MNLQQLNGSGRSLNIFILTAFVALGITVTVWWLMEESRNFQKWRSEIEKPLKEEKSVQVQCATCTIFVRMYVLQWICRNHLLKPMLLAGAVSCLIRKPSTPFHSPPLNLSWSFEPREEESIFSYVSRLITMRRRGYYDYENITSSLAPKTFEKGCWPCFEHSLIQKCRSWASH